MGVKYRKMSIAEPHLETLERVIPELFAELEARGGVSDQTREAMRMVNEILLKFRWRDRPEVRQQDRMTIARAEFARQFSIL